MPNSNPEKTEVLQSPSTYKPVFNWDFPKIQSAIIVPKTDLDSSDSSFLESMRKLTPTT